MSDVGKPSALRSFPFKLYRQEHEARALANVDSSHTFRGTPCVRWGSLADRKRTKSLTAVY